MTSPVKSTSHTPVAYGLILLLLASLPLLESRGVTAEPRAPGLVFTRRARVAFEKHAARLTPQLRTRGFRLGAPIFIRIFKISAELEVWIERPDGTFALFRTYPICALSGSIGPKTRLGDGQCPEGFYSVSAKMMAPWSRFHLAFNLGFPNAHDRHHGWSGSALMVHGGCASTGCFAMTNDGIEEIYTLAAAALRGGQTSFQVHIFPFRMNDREIDRHRDSPWIDFWRNLEDGYDLFERYRRPPTVGLRRGRYAFAMDSARRTSPPRRGARSGR